MGNLEKTNLEIPVEFAVGRSDGEFECDGITTLVTPRKAFAGKQRHIVGEAVVAVDRAVDAGLLDAFADAETARPLSWIGPRQLKLPPS